MITIRESNFEMIQSSGSSFNLMIPKIINKGTDKERIELSIVGHNLSFEYCIKFLVESKMSNYTEVYSIKEYIKKYAETVDEICSLIKIENETV